MKKIVSVFLLLAFMATLSITAFAEENVGTGGYTTDVNGSYVPGATSNGTVFSVDITWTNMTFTYHAEKGLVWDTETHSYSEYQPAYWEGKGNITVTNHSNAKISAVPSYAAKTGYEDAYMTFSTEKLALASAADNNQAVTGTIAVTPAGSLPAMSESATIGSITVTIAQIADVTIEEARALLNEVKAYCEDYESAAAPENLGNDFMYLVAECANFEGTIDSYEKGSCNQESFNREYDSLLDRYNSFKTAN